MTATSYYDSNFLPAYGRLHFAGGWCARSPSRNNEWLMVDLGQLYRVCGVATQGYDGGNVWVTAFKLFYSRDGKSWTSYEDVIGTEMVRFNIICTKDPTKLTLFLVKLSWRNIGICFGAGLLRIALGYRKIPVILAP